MIHENCQGDQLSTPQVKYPQQSGKKKENQTSVQFQQTGLATDSSVYKIQNQPIRLNYSYGEKKHSRG